MNRISALRTMALLPFTVAAVTALMVACSDMGCLENRSSIPYAGFYAYETESPISIDSVEIGGVGAPNDSLLMTADDRYSNLYFPFRFEQDNTTFFLRYVSQELNYPWLVDTIYFSYTSLPVFVSENCGAMYQYLVTEMRYTNHLIDSIALTDSLITNTNVERIKIFFRTEQPGDDDGVDESPADGDDEPWEGDITDNDEGGGEQQ